MTVNDFISTYTTFSRVSFPEPPRHNYGDVYDGRRELRSQSEYQMPRNGTSELGQRATSCPDESDLFSEVTVCMSQVKSLPRKNYEKKSNWSKLFESPGYNIYAVI